MRLRTGLILAVALMLALSVFATHMSGAGQIPVSVFTYSPAIPTPEEVIQFDASDSYDPDGWITQYAWDFGDGNTAITATPTVTHSYPVDGNYTVQLVVTDNSGSTAASSTIVQVQCVVFFRVISLFSGYPLQDVEVTVYYKKYSSWKTAPVSSSGLEILYDRMTQPDLANTYAEKYRNPGYTASILRKNASNIGFDIHKSSWTVFFKFQWGPYISYWPNDTTRVYSYNNGIIETHDYTYYHRAYWDPTAGTYVINVDDIRRDGVCPTESHPIIVGMWCPPPTTQYYLTVRTDPLGITAIPGEGWYNNGTVAALTAPQYVDASAGTRYRFDYWDIDGNPQGAGISSINVMMSANHTATAHYITQYSVTFSQTGLDSTTTGTVVTVNGNPETFGELPYVMWVDSGGSTSYSYASTVSSTVSGKRFRLDSTSGPASPITVTCPITVTGNYVVQYLVTFAQTGLDSTATGTVVTVNGSSKTYGNIPFEWWVDSGSSITYTYSSTISSSIQGKQFRLTGVNCPPQQFVVTEPTTITGSYCTQYLVTFAQTGLDSTATGTVVTVNGTAKTYSGLPYTFWVDSSSDITYVYSSPIPSSNPSTQFALNNVTGSTSPFTVTGSTTVTGNYVTQCLVTFTQGGLDATASGTVVTVSGSPKVYGDLPYVLWVDSGSSVTYSYESVVSSSAPGKQFRLTSVTGPSSPITVTGAVIVTGNYVTQYSVTFTHAGLDSTASGTVATVSGSPKVYGDLPYVLWVDSGSSVTYSYESVVSSSASGKQFRLTSVSGPASPITVSGATTVTGNYVVQYLVTFAQTGLDSTATGTVVTVNGNPKTFTNLPFNTWIDSGSSITYSYNSIVLSSVSGKRFSQTTVSGPVSPITVTSSVTVTGNYKIQYQVTFDQLGVGSDFVGTILTIDGGNYHYNELPTAPFWWDKDSNHTFSFVSPLIVNASLSYAWSSTSGLTSLQAGTLTITASGNVVGNYVVQNSITFDQTGASSDFTGTILVVDGAPYTVTDLPRSFTWQIGSVHTFAFQSPLVVASNTKQYVWTGTTGLSTLQSGSITVSIYGDVIGHYKTQYYVDLATDPQGLGSPSGTGWYDDGTYASVSTPQYIYGGSRWRFAGWTTADMSEITDPTSPSTTILIDQAKTVTANYIHQYEVIFTQTGLDSSAGGTVATVNGTSKTYTDLPYAIWVDESSTLIYSYETTVTSITSGKQFRLDSVSGSSSPITVSTDTTVTGNYVAQYYLTVSSPYGTAGGQGWYDSGVSAYATLNTSMIDHGNGTRHVFTAWGGDASGTNYAQSNPITMNGPKGAIADWKTQYCVTFTHSGLDSSALGTVATVNGVPVTFGGLPHIIWTDDGGSVTYSYDNVSSITVGKKFVLMGVSGPPSPMTVSSPLTITGNYKIQYQITLGESGVGSDFTGTVVAIDGAPYTRNALPAAFWWDSGSSHTFSFLSPLVVNISTQYSWSSTAGLSALQSDTLIITESGNVTGNYIAEGKHEVTFNQNGVEPDFTGAVIIVDGSNYDVVDLPVSFWWDTNSIHTFAYQSPLVVSPNLKQYVWTNTSGPCPWQSGSINVTASAALVGNYKTMFYLTMATDPASITTPTGAGWYDSGVLATISTQAYIDIVPGSSRYRFNGWTTPDIIEITDPLSSPTTVLMDKGKTATALYATQYNVTFKQTGVNPDFTETIVTIDGRDYNFSGLPVSFYWDDSSVHIFAYQSPLVVTPNAKQYVWTSTTGLSTLQGDSMTVSSFGDVTGNYNTQYYLMVSSPYGITGGQGWYDSGATAYATLNTGIYDYGTGTRRVFTSWSGDGSGTNYAQSNPITMNGPKSAIANWKTQCYLMVNTNPLGIVSIPGEGWYDAGTNVQLTAPPVPSHTFSEWKVDGTSQGLNVTLIDVVMNASHSAIAYYQQQMAGTPVGGISFLPTENASRTRLTTYFVAVAMLGLAVSLLKRKRK